MLKRFLVLGMAMMAIFAFTQKVALADDCTISVANNALILTHGAVTVPAITFGANFIGGAPNSLTTTLIQNGPTTAFLVLDGPNLSGFTTNIVANGSTTINLLMSGAGGVFNPNPLNLVGTLTAGVVTFNSTQFTYVNAAANVCATFSLSIAPITLAALQSGVVPLSFNIGIVACADCVNRAPVPEPATMLLLGTGLAGLASRVRKWRLQSATS